MNSSNKQNFNSQNNQLKVIYWNCNGLMTKIEEFKNFIFNKSPDLILLNETKFNEDRAKHFFNLHFEDNYNFVHKHRENHKNGGGGVCILIKKYIKFNEINDFEDLNLELISLNLHINNNDLKILCYYIF